MEIDALLTLGIVFLAAPAGFFIGHMTKEELQGSRRYFFLVQDFILIALLFFVLSLYVPTFFALILAAIPASQFVLLSSKYDKQAYRVRDRLLYVLVGVLFGLLLVKQESVLVAIGMVFLYGLLAGTLLVKGNHPWKSVVKEFSFLLLFLPAAVLPFLLTYV